MSRARSNSTPYAIQLAAWLQAPDSPPTFSAQTLAEIFDLSPRQKAPTALGQIHHALMKAWSDGLVVAFHNAEGRPLRERERGQAGSAAIQHPQIFGLLSAPSPDPAYAAITHEESVRTNGRPHALAADVATTDSDDDDAVGEPDTSLELAEAQERQDDTARTPAADDLARALKSYRPDSGAPAWIPDPVLARLVTLPAALRTWRKGLEQAPQAEKLALIRAGVRRKGDVPSDSVTALRLAELARASRDAWGRTMASALHQFQSWGDEIAEEDLPRLVEDALSLVGDEAGCYAGEVVLLTGLAVGSEQDALALIAADLADSEPVVSSAPSAGEVLRHRADSLEAELTAIRKLLKDGEKELRSARAETAGLKTELERLREQTRLAGTADEKRSAAEANSAARVTELEEQAAAMEAAHDALLAESASAELERRLREQAEARLQEQLRLERDRSRARARGEDHAGLPVEDAASLLRALAPPIGEAVSHAARRMVDGTPLADDHRLMEFAAAYGRLGELAEPAPDPAEVRRVEAALAEDSPAQEGLESVESALQSAPPAEGSDPDAEEREPPEPERRSRTARRRTAFTVRPFGGAGEVGGSAILVQTRSGDTVLLDAGQRVKGEYGLESANQFHYGLPGVERLHAVVVSHAHIDHVGSLPILHQERSDAQGELVPVYMSEPTRKLSEVMLRDSVKIQHARQHQLAELGGSDFAAGTMSPAYTDADVVAALSAVESLEPREPRQIPDTSLTVKLVPVAHVLGSCAVHLTDNETGATLLYSGDLGPLTDQQSTLPDFGGADAIDQADVVIMESTYGLLDAGEVEGRRRRGQEGRDRELQLFFDAAEKAFEAGGHVLLPAFSLGRTQELARIIHTYAGDRLPKGRIHLGGMGERILELYNDYGRPGDRWVRPGDWPGITPINRWLREAGSFEEVVHDILTGESSYIIASPAMLSGGWSRAFLHEMVGDARQAVVFTGYLPRHGGGIRNLSQLHTNSQFKLDEQTVTIKCLWEKPSLSAHAPARDLRRFAERMARGRDEVAFGMLHGNPASQAALAEDVQSALDNATATPLDNGVPWEPQRG